MLHKIIQVIPTKDFKVYLYFENGKIKLFNAFELINKGIFKQISETDFFVSRCTVLNDTLAWDLKGDYDDTACLDLDPEELYRACPEVKEPVIQTA